MESKDWSGFGYLSPGFSPGMPVSQRIWNPRGFEITRSKSASGYGPPSQIWTPLPNIPFKHPLYHIWLLILFASFFVVVLFDHNTTFLN